jgi:hypothetical protein
MPVLNISRVIQSPNFSQSFLVTRSIGSWSSAGIFTTNAQVIQMTGVITPEATKNMRQENRLMSLRGAL